MPGLRLAQFHCPAHQPAGGDYSYDWVGNRTSPPAGCNAMVYNAVDQLVKWPGMHGTTSTPGYVYDSAGNLTTVKNPSASANVATYSYLDSGLLHQATDGTNTIITNTWDADSNRVALDAGGASYSFVYDVTAGIPAVIDESSGTSSVYYIREPGGALIARLHPTDGIRYYHFDELGSTRLLTDSGGTVTDRYAYDAYGALISHDRLTGSVDQPYQYVGRLGYYTHYQEPDFGLLQLGVRFYDAQTGRFTQRDAAAHSADPAYVYVDDCPIYWVDASGRTKSKPKFPDIPKEWKKCIENAFNKFCGSTKGVSKKMIRCMIWVESKDGKQPNGPGGARGLLQLKPEWWDPRNKTCQKHKKWGSRCQDKTSAGEKFDVDKACDNIECGVWQLCEVFNGDTDAYGTTLSPAGRAAYDKCMREYSW